MTGICVVVVVVFESIYIWPPVGTAVHIQLNNVNSLLFSIALIFTDDDATVVVEAVEAD